MGSPFVFLLLPWSSLLARLVVIRMVLHRLIEGINSLIPGLDILHIIRRPAVVFQHLDSLDQLVLPLRVFGGREKLPRLGKFLIMIGPTLLAHLLAKCLAMKLELLEKHDGHSVVSPDGS